MKIAVLSDIHGNLLALEAVLADVARRGADVAVNLGDILSGGLWPAETANRLIPLDLPTIRGNHERQVLTLQRERMGLSDGRAADMIEPAHRKWLEGLPTSMRLTDEVLMVHGTPASDLEYWLETVTPEGMRPATPEEALDRAGDVQASVILCGHTHIPRSMWLADGRLVVNPGSVGLPAYEDDRPYPTPAAWACPPTKTIGLTRTRWRPVRRMHDMPWSNCVTGGGRRTCWRSTTTGNGLRTTRPGTGARTGRGLCGRGGPSRPAAPSGPGRRRRSGRPG